MLIPGRGLSSLPVAEVKKDKDGAWVFLTCLFVFGLVYKVLLGSELVSSYAVLLFNNLTREGGPCSQCVGRFLCLAAPGGG